MCKPEETGTTKAWQQAHQRHPSNHSQTRSLSKPLCVYPIFTQTYLHRFWQDFVKKSEEALSVIMLCRICLPLLLQCVQCLGRNPALVQCRELTHLAIFQSDMHTGVETGHLEECKVCRGIMLQLSSFLFSVKAVVWGEIEIQLGFFCANCYSGDSQLLLWWLTAFRPSPMPFTLDLHSSKNPTIQKSTHCMVFVLYPSYLSAGNVVVI